MRSSIIAAAALLIAPVAVFAQLPADLPECAATCLVNGIATNGCGTDIACNCKKQEFVNSVATCINSGCSPAEAGKSIEVAKQLCLSQQVTITVPSGSATVSNTASGTTTAVTTTGTASTTAPVVTTTGTTTFANGTTSTFTGTNSTTTPTPTDNAAGQYGVHLGVVGLALAGFAAL